MPSWAIHLLTAKRLSNKIDVDKNIFLIGNLLTDLLNGYVIKEVSSHVLHSETHFDTMTVFDGKKAKRPDLVGFKKKYGKHFLNNPLILGYYTHLATDYFWNSKTYDEYGIFNEEGKRIGVKLNNGKEKICQKEEIRKLKTNDFKIFSAHIYEKEMIEKIYWDDNIMTYLKQFDWIKFEKTDIEVASKKWDEIKKAYAKTVESNKYPRILYKSHGVIKKLLLDLIDKDLEKIILNNQEDYDYITKVVTEFKADNIKVELKEGENLIENTPDLQKQIERAENRRVWLKCGGFIAIDKTEALTAIDVNSGKYIGKDNAEATIFKVNKQASIEIAKQLRLRDIGGIVIIDYIDMQEEEDKEKIINILTEELNKDRSKTQVVGFSKLNLLEMTRKHICG